MVVSISREIFFKRLYFSFHFFHETSLIFWVMVTLLKINSIIWKWLKYYIQWNNFLNNFFCLSDNIFLKCVKKSSSSFFMIFLRNLGVQCTSYGTCLYEYLHYFVKVSNIKIPSRTSFVFAQCKIYAKGAGILWNLTLLWKIFKTLFDFVMKVEPKSLR